MKKVISVLLCVVLLIGTLGCFSAFAREKYPPLETGYHQKRDLVPYLYKITGTDSGTICYDELPNGNFLATPIEIDEALQNKIKHDYWNDEYQESQSEVQCFGILSDGSMLVDISGGYVTSALYYMVIGKYVYFTFSSEQVLIYKDSGFSFVMKAYQDGQLSDSLLDEIAQIMHFAEFADSSAYSEKSEEHTLATGYHQKQDLIPYKYEITATQYGKCYFDSLPYDDMLAKEIKIDESVKAQIKRDYNSDGQLDESQLEVKCFGILTDGSMVVDISGGLTDTNGLYYRVIGDYVYPTTSTHEVLLYQNSGFSSVMEAYQNGELSDALLDQVAKVMHFPKFAEYIPRVTEPDNQPGDVNKDGIVNIADVTQIQRHVAKIITLEDEAIADLDGDGEVTINDATLLQKLISEGVTLS